MVFQERMVTLEKWLKYFSLQMTLRLELSDIRCFLTAVHLNSLDQSEHTLEMIIFENIFQFIISLLKGLEADL